MKKATFWAAAMLMGVTVAASPLQAMAASPLQAQAGSQQTKAVKIVSAGKIEKLNTDALKDHLENCGWGNVNVITIPCLPGNLDGILGNPCLPENQPDTEAPGVENPEMPEAPETPGTNTPETPEAPEVNNPVTPETPETNQPETEQPGENDPNQSVHEYALRVVELVNEEREKAGLNALTLREDITEAAHVRAVESETLFSHTRPDGTSFATALQEAGVSYRGAGENIAWGQKTPEEVMQGWMNSAGHRANILNEKYTSIGVGYYQNSAGVNYWSQLFTY